MRAKKQAGEVNKKPIGHHDEDKTKQIHPLSERATSPHNEHSMHTII
jgi:hypothetical protein